MRILICEDEHRIANTIKKGLEQEKHAVDTAYDGISGYDLATSEDYDLIILDLMLPGKDGINILKDLRKNNINTPILILTAKGLTEDKVKGLNMGADDYLTKPFSFEELLARIKALGRRPKSNNITALKVDQLILNPNNFEVTRNKIKINLTSKEYSLLEFLMRHKGTILKKENIISHVWNYDDDILPNTIEVYIKNLRNKIDHPFPKHKQLIKTVRGFGYKIEE